MNMSTSTNNQLPVQALPQYIIPAVNKSLFPLKTSAFGLRTVDTLLIKADKSLPEADNSDDVIAKTDADIMRFMLSPSKTRWNAQNYSRQRHYAVIQCGMSTD